MSEKPAEDLCSTCQQYLNDSVIIEKDGEVFKSCLHAQAKQELMFSINMIILVCEIWLIVDSSSSHGVKDVDYKAV